MTEPSREFLSCDWGTTSFRLRWVRGADCVVMRELRESTGVKSLHEESLRRGASSEAVRGEMFAGFLRGKLEALIGREAPTSPLPLVISGMASSSLGWKELPYANAPFALDGRDVRAQELHWDKPEWLGPTLLISGVATEHEMMRGEETEIIGLMAEPKLAVLRERCLLILPGTHSKHVRIERGSVVDWRTFMTGELFEVLGRHSLLRASVDFNAPRELNSESDRAAFREGVRWAQEHGLPGGLFRVRTRAVLGKHPLAENTWFFSGLLIGAELAGLGGEESTIVLAATGSLAEPYALALKIIAREEGRWTHLSLEQVGSAVVRAHALFLRDA